MLVECSPAGSCTRSPPTNGSEFRAKAFGATVEHSAPGSASSAPDGPTPTAASNASSSPSSRNAGAPRSHSHSCPRAPHWPKTSLDYLNEYNYDRAHTGRLTQGRVPADIVYGARKTTTVR